MISFFNRDDLYRTRIRAVPHAIREIRRDVSFSNISIATIFFHDLTSGVIGILFKIFRTQVPAGTTARAIFTSDDAGCHLSITLTEFGRAWLIKTIIHRSSLGHIPPEPFKTCRGNASLEDRLNLTRRPCDEEARFSRNYPKDDCRASSFSVHTCEIDQTVLDHTISRMSVSHRYVTTALRNLHRARRKVTAVNIRSPVKEAAISPGVCT